MNNEDVSKAFYSQPMNNVQLSLAKRIRDIFAEMNRDLVNNIPSGRYKSLAITRLEESAMYVTKAITHEWKD